MTYYFAGTSIKNDVLELVKSYDLTHDEKEMAAAWLFRNVLRHVYRYIGEQMDMTGHQARKMEEGADKLRLDDWRFMEAIIEMRKKLTDDRWKCLARD